MVRILCYFMVLVIGCSGCMDSTKKTSNPVSSQSNVTQTEKIEGSGNLSNEKKSWWIKRKEDHQQSGAEEINLKKYNAYYIDEKRKDKKVLYLTFDCGFDNGYTEPMLDILKKHKAKAIFFVTQTYIRDNISIVKRMKKEGHLVGNHTVKHKSMPDLSERDIKEELVNCATYCKEATGYEMDLYMRPPMGEYSERTLQICKDLGYTTVFWSMAYLDYDVKKQPGKQFVVDHFEKYYHNGAVALLHNVSSSNAEALDDVLTNLEKKGYKFPTIDQIDVK